MIFPICFTISLQGLSIILVLPFRVLYIIFLCYCLAFFPFFFFCIDSKTFLTISLPKQNTKLTLTLAISTGAPTTVANKILDKPIAGNKAGKVRSTYSNNAINL